MTNMKKFLTTFSGQLTLSLFVAAGIFVPQLANALGLADLALSLPGLLMSTLIMPATSLLVYLSGMVLNWSVEYSVINMKANYAAANIDAVWTVMRDLANMGFIFVLLYTAIMTIFGQGKYKETITKMVVAALLINFSLFITKAIIDASNVLSLLFYNAISPGVNVTNAASVGISSSFMNALGIQGLYKATSLLSGTKMVIIGAAGSVIYLISAFTFLAVAAMFMIRFIVLLFVAALSPLMFVGSIFPGAGGYTKQWWSALTSQAFFAPVYFMMTWVTLKVAQGLFHGGGDIAGAVVGKQVGSTFTADPSAAQTLVGFVIIIGFLIGSLMIAKSTSGKAAGGVTKMAFAWAGGATLGMAGRVGRGTIGRAGAQLASSETVKNAIEKGGVAGAAGRLALLAGNKGAKSSFDLRATGIGGMLDGGKVKRGTSFEQDVKNRNKATLERARYLKPSETVLAAAKDKNEKAQEAYEDQLKTAGYTEPAELTAAKAAVKASAKRVKGDSQEDWDDRKEEAKKALEDAQKADAPTREALAAAHPELQSAKTEADEADKAFQHIDKRAERFITKESEPTFQVPTDPESLVRVLPFLKTDNIAAGNINKKGVGGAFAAGVRDIASEEREKADAARAKMHDEQRDMGTVKRIFHTAATPKFWANRASAGFLSGIATVS
ncbi:MAG: seg, partial [Parcubacteria group bacterium]|nr:seg [Parcubacteria group bacterium]